MMTTQTLPMAATSDPEAPVGGASGAPDPRRCSVDEHEAGRDLTDQERALNNVDQEFSRLVIGVRNEMRERITQLDPSLLPFDLKTMTALWHHAVRLPETPTLTGRELSDILEADKSMVSRSVKRLEACDLLTRTVNPEDARIQLISVTQHGYDRYKQVTADSPSWISSQLRTWDIASLDHLAALLHRINGPLPE